MKMTLFVLLTTLSVGLVSAVGLASTGSEGAVAAEKPGDTLGVLVVTTNHSKLLRAKADIYRTHVDDPSVCKLAQFNPRELSISGKKAGVANVTIWLSDGKHRSHRLRVRVVAE